MVIGKDARDNVQYQSVRNQNGNYDVNSKMVELRVIFSTKSSAKL